MPAAVVIRLEDGCRDEPDCAIVSLSAYLGESYADVIRAVAVADRRKGRDGVSRRGIVRVAAKLGHTLRKRRVDPEEGHGIIVTHDHAAVLLYGRVLDRHTNWPLEVWLLDQETTMNDCDVYTAVEE